MAEVNQKEERYFNQSSIVKSNSNGNKYCELVKVNKMNISRDLNDNPKIILPELKLPDFSFIKPIKKEFKS